MKVLVRAGELRGGADRQTAPNVLFDSAYTERVRRHFRALTGITPTRSPRRLSARAQSVTCGRIVSATRSIVSKIAGNVEYDTSSAT